MAPGGRTIVYDPHKRSANLEKHGFDSGALDVEFFLDAVSVEGKKGGRLQSAGSMTKSSRWCIV
jgi:uncharacterized DUF497 family protein